MDLRRLARLFAPLVVLAFVAAACGSAPALAPVGSPLVTSAPVASAPVGAKADLKKLDIGIGVFPFGPMQRSFWHYDEKNHVIAQVARDLGYDLRVKWKLFSGAPAELPAFNSGDIVIGPMATFPLIAQTKQGRKFQVLTNTLGMYRFFVMVQKGGRIRTFEDLKGKTVGVALGSAHQSAFEQFLLAEFGQPSSALGIKYVNQPVPVPTMPPGLDAYVTFIPAILPALEDPNAGIEPLLSLSPGETGSAYDGPLGRGAGHPIPSAEKSQFYPEGYTSLRNPFVVTDAFLKAHPDVVKAFVIAHERVNRELAALPPSKVTDLWPSNAWEQMPRRAFEERSLAVDLVYKFRDWVWPAKGLADIMWAESEAMVKMGVLKDPLSQEELRSMFAQTTPILKAAYEALGQYPPEEVFLDTHKGDRRGPPIWEVDWSTYRR